MLRQSGSILLDRDGIVRFTHVSADPGGSCTEHEAAAEIAAPPRSKVSPVGPGRHEMAGPDAGLRLCLHGPRPFERGSDSRGPGACVV